MKSQASLQVSMNSSDNDTSSDDGSSSEDDTAMHISLVAKESIKKSNRLTRQKRQENRTTRELDALHEASCCISDAHESDAKPSDCDIIQRAPSVSGSKASKKRIKWTDKDNEIIETEFESFIQLRGEGGKGNLPNKSLIYDFLTKQKIAAVSHMTPRKQYKAIRIHVYNLRQMTRRRTETRMRRMIVKL